MHHIHISIYMYIYIYICLYMFVCVCVRVYICACVWIYTYICIYIYICIYTYTRTCCDTSIYTHMLRWRRCGACSSWRKLQMTLVCVFVGVFCVVCLFVCVCSVSLYMYTYMCVQCVNVCERDADHARSGERCSWYWWPDVCVCVCVWATKAGFDIFLTWRVWIW